MTPIEAVNALRPIGRALDEIGAVKLPLLAPDSLRTMQREIAAHGRAIGSICDRLSTWAASEARRG